MFTLSRSRKNTLNKLPVVVIVGRPNVGKSLFFNRMCGQRASIVHAAPGMTLDYISETAVLNAGRSVRLIDTGGVEGEEDEWSNAVRQRMEQAAAQADMLLIMTDARAGLQHGDQAVLSLARKRWPDLPRLVLVNKAEGLGESEACADFYAWGEPLLPVSAKRGSGLTALREKLSAMLPPAVEAAQALPVAIIGRPNVGKSTLMNCLLRKDRVIVSPRPGTTRDNVRAGLSSRSGEFLLIDTAGMRRRRAEGRERLSVTAARTALQQAATALFMFDLAAGVTHQDKRLAVLAAEAGCGVVVLGNKCDLLHARARQKELRQQTAELPLGFVAPAFAISATGGRLAVNALLLAARESAKAAQTQFSTARLNRALAEAVRDNPPPFTRGVRPKLRYAHQGGRAPLRVVVHGGGVARIGADYRRYLAAALARKLAVTGAPLRVDFRAEDNPYVG